MHFAIGSIKNSPTTQSWKSKRTEHVGSTYAIEEINAYIAIRDQLLDEAERVKTLAKIDSVVVANDFVASCLRPARSPYQTQCLPEANARREQKRCTAISTRLGMLRAAAI